MRYTVTKAFRPKGSGSPEAAIGSELELTESQARVFKAVGFVKDTEHQAVESSAQAVRSYLRRDMTAESEPSAAPARKVAAKKTTRTYTRRNAE